MNLGCRRACLSFGDFLVGILIEIEHALGRICGVPSLVLYDLEHVNLFWLRLIDTEYDFIVIIALFRLHACILLTKQARSATRRLALSRVMRETAR